MFDTISHPAKRAFLSAFSECGSVSEAAEIAGVSRDLHYDWKAADTQYSYWFTQARHMAADRLEERARKRAEEADIAGVKLMMFLLRGLKPEVYGIQRIESQSTVKHQHEHLIDLTQLSDEQLKTLEQLAKFAIAGPPVDRSGDPAPEAAQTGALLPG
jgi:hypothetical protein